MSLLHVAILAIVQGITEFLPISSSGHLVLIGHVGVQHAGRARMLAVDARVDAGGGELQFALALQHLAVEIDQQQVAGGKLRPVDAEGVDQEGVRPLRRGVAEVVADALVQIEAGEL